MTTFTGVRTKSTRLPGLICKEHFFQVPLNYDNPKGAHIEIFARELVAPENAENSELPAMVFLQGGPGFESPRPEGADGWIKRALSQYRVILLDQRGTGLSSPVTHQTLEALPDAATQAEYLSHFRADNIVRDCEFIRESINEGRPWTIVGQSYGGFCSVTYLSLAPAGLCGAIIFGGLPPLRNNPDDVYRACYKQVIAKNEAFYRSFPEDIEVVRRIVSHLQSTQVCLPCGEVLSPERFLQLGLNLGFTSSGRSLIAIHYLLERAFLSPKLGADTLSYTFLRNVDYCLSFNTNPIYALLHEPIYCQGQSSNWSAQRILPQFPQFSHENDCVYFTGEMIYPWMFDQYQCLKPLKEAALILAAKSDWPDLYNTEVLARNTVPTVAVVYYDDMYVDRDLSLETAKTIAGIKLWITNEYQHDGIRVDGVHLLDKALALLTL